MKERLGRAASWLGLVACLLFLFSLWFFLFRSDPPATGAELIGKACPGERVSEIEGATSVVRFRAEGCGAIEREVAEKSLVWARLMQDRGLERLRLPELPERFVIDLRTRGRSWQSKGSPGWPGAVTVRVSVRDPETRFRLDSGLVYLALEDVSPRTPSGQRRRLAEALALKLPWSQGAGVSFLVPRSSLALSRQISLRNYPDRLCAQGCRLQGP